MRPKRLLVMRKCGNYEAEHVTPERIAYHRLFRDHYWLFWDPEQYGSTSPKAGDCDSASGQHTDSTNTCAGDRNGGVGRRAKPLRSLWRDAAGQCPIE